MEKDKRQGMIRIQKPTLGIDIGSTTAKLVWIENGEVKYEAYERHFSQVREKLLSMLEPLKQLAGDRPFAIAISGSAGIDLAKGIEVPFIQEVFVVGELIKEYEPDTKCVVELGGEDAKIIFFDGTTDERMNGTCAGGTGAFIDQMATLLNVTNDQMDKLALQHTKLYPIASRCGVFAKSDIQPLLNQGANKSDVAASIYQAVVNQTIAGLARGKKIQGKVLFLGGPLYYCKGLQQRFKETLKLTDQEAVFPEYGRYAVSLGTAIYADKAGTKVTYDDLTESLRHSIKLKPTVNTLKPLFNNEEEYEKFRLRHAKDKVELSDISAYFGPAWLGIDCGSTTTKLVLIGENNEIIYTYYAFNQGNPVDIVKEQLLKIYELGAKRIILKGSAVTGYGEDLIKNGFNIDLGVVETIAHFTAAKCFCPDVDFILDIGGQDIKCFKIHNGAIDSIMLNEACSSGCGSFIETFAKGLGSEVKDFAQQGLFAKHPVDLGSRCTVFMNSSVKQAQKDGAEIADISAGLSISVVKNAIYKVIRATSAQELGNKVVVQGGTFYNDAILAAFERELGKEVTRPTIAGLMGAYGTALYVKQRVKESKILDKVSLENFSHEAKALECQGCTNHCHLTINTFSGGRRYISGNRCDKALGYHSSNEDVPNLYAYKRQKLLQFQGGSGKRGTIGIPLALGMYELLPLWYGIFTALGFKVELSGMSTKAMYELGQFSIPSDTVCYPAKLMHGHILTLLNKGVKTIFYPCLSYNVDEHQSDNHYNCPVVAYYAELLAGNVDELKKVNFWHPYLNINDDKELTKELHQYLKPYYSDLSVFEVRRAVKKGFETYRNYMQDIRTEGEAALEYAHQNNKRIMILAGRPYHIDEEIGHGIDQLALSLGFVVVSEDAVCHLAKNPKIRVLNQWTYHARLYKAAQYATEHEDTQLVQLVSFGCGVDAITTDEVRSILEEKGKYYTQLKIDEITNLGAVKIRLRSLLGVLEMK